MWSGKVIVHTVQRSECALNQRRSVCTRSRRGQCARSLEEVSVHAVRRSMVLGGKEVYPPPQQLPGNPVASAPVTTIPR